MTPHVHVPEPDLYFVTCRRPHSTTSEAGVCRPLVCIPLARARETCRDTAQQAYTCGPYTRDSTHPVQTPPHQFSRDIPHTAQHGKTVACPPTSCSCGDAKQDVFHMRFPSSGRQEHHLLVSPAPSPNANAERCEPTGSHRQVECQVRHRFEHSTNSRKALSHADYFVAPF